VVKPEIYRPHSFTIAVLDGDGIGQNRESTARLFHSKDKGGVTETEAIETLLITRDTWEKPFDFACALARGRKQTGRGPGRVTCVDKANVFRACAFFRKIFDARAARNPDLPADHASVDAMRCGWRCGCCRGPGIST